MILQNTKNVHLMTWETNPSKRNTNNTITFVSTLDNIENGQKIYCSFKDGKYSTYTIIDILDRRKSSHNGMINYKVKTKWSNEFKPR